jgi:hypothetical protein
LFHGAHRGSVDQRVQRLLVAVGVRALGLGQRLEPVGDLVETFVSQRLTWEGDDLLFKSEDGRMIPVKDGIAGIAKARPELLKSTGTGGAGVRASNAGGGGPKTMTRAEFEALAPAQRVEAAKSGVQLV